MIMEWLGEIEFWHWWVAAVVFITIEIFTVGAVFLWLSVAAAVTGFVLLAAPGLDWKIQLIVFAVSAVAVALGWRAYRKRRPAAETDQPALNRRGTQYVDRHFTLEEPIVNGQGKLRIDDTIWKIEGEDLPEGTKVRVAGVDGTLLRIERA